MILGMTLFIEMCLITFLFLWLNVPFIPILLVVFALFPDLERQIYLTVYKHQSIFINYGIRNAKIATWWTREVLID